MITLIAAVARNGVIGQGNTIPWHLPEDFKHFSRTTKGHVVLMGSKTWDSLPARFRPLPDRVNIVISRGRSDSGEGAIWCPDIDTALSTARNHDKEIFVIGGASIYEQTIGIADRLLISYVDLEPDGDTYFPPIDPNWGIISETQYEGFKLVEYQSRA